MVNKYTVDHGAIHKDWPPGRMEMVTAADYDSAQKRSAQTDQYYAEGYESGAMDLHKWMRRAERAETRSSEALRILERVRAALATTPYWRSLREEVESVLTPVDGGGVES